MASVLNRAKAVKQPRGGFIKLSEFKRTLFQDGRELNESENIHGNVIGLAVDYLSRILIGSAPEDAFFISLEGAKNAENNGIKNAKKIAANFLSDIKGNDDSSIISACKLVTFDTWFRNPAYAFESTGYEDTNPDPATVENIHILLDRCLSFFKEYGPVTANGFTFGGSDAADEYEFESCGNPMGGYTFVVSTGDGDFLTSDTLWDMKVSKSAPTSQHTLQLLMYWIMGQHSGKKMFHGIKKIGIFNPRLNVVYQLDISDVSPSVIKEVEDYVICY